MSDDIEDLSFLKDVENMLFQNAIACDISEEKAIKITTKTIADIKFKYSSEQVYINKDLDSRDKEIYDKFTGNNYRELGIEYNLSPRAIRSAVDKINEKRIEKEQIKMF